MVAKLHDDDIIMMTADHGCDPAYLKTTDHTREYIPFIMYGKNVTPRNLGTRSTFADIAATVLDYFKIKPEFEGTSMLG
jgi:phosphopentomutase